MSSNRVDSFSTLSKRNFKYDYNRNESISESDEEGSDGDREDDYNDVLHKYGMHLDGKRYDSERFGNIYV